MKTRWLIAIAASQVLVLAYMAGEREWVLRTGRTVFLRTAPVDPRDVMRGDYVRLNYELSAVPRSLWRGRLASLRETAEALPRDTKVYASLHVNEDNLGELISLSSERPEQEPYLRGRVEQLSGGNLQVRYGLEAYFLEQRKGVELEQGRDRAGIQVALEMHVKVSPSGLAVLKDHRWCDLGIGLDLETAPQTVVSNNGSPPLRTVAARVRLLNAGTHDLAIVDLPGGRSLALVPDSQWSENPWRWTRDPAAPMSPTADQIKVLKPGQIHSMQISFNDPWWTVAKHDNERTGPETPVRFADVSRDWSARFRLEYRPPPRAHCTNLPHANLVWHGRLPSRAFSAGGNID